MTNDTVSWEPSDQDVQWLVNLLDKLKVGGVWIAPSYGVIFNKIGENELELRQPLIVDAKAIEMIERTMIVAEKAGIHIEKPDAIIFLPPTPFMHKSENYTCEDCGGTLTEDEKITMSDEKTILCSQCLWTGRGGVNSKSSDA